MNTEQEIHWREEFEVHWRDEALNWSFPLGRHHKNLVKEAGFRVYILARKKADEEIQALGGIKKYPTALGYISELREEIKECEKEISQLKEELKRERFLTNEVARMSSNQDEFESNGCVGEYIKQDHRYAYEVIIGLARKAQQQRKIEL